VCIAVAYLIAKYRQLRINRRRCQRHIDEFNKPRTPGLFQGIAVVVVVVVVVVLIYMQNKNRSVSV